MLERTYIIPFTQGTTGTFSLGNNYGSTGHILPWVLIGEDSKKIHLYGYDDNNSSSNKWYLNLLDKTIENNVQNDYSLKYVKKKEEVINLEKFQCNSLSLEVFKELNQYYELKYIIIGQEQPGSTPGPEYFERFQVSNISENKYHFDINTTLRIKDINKSFIFGLKYRENCDKNDTQVQVFHDPKNTILFKLILKGNSFVNNRYTIRSEGIFDYRPYEKKFIIRQEPHENGFLRYKSLKEVYRYKSNGIIHTLYEFIISNSVLYNILIKGTNPNDDVYVNELKISHGKLVLTMKIIGEESGYLFNPERTKIEFCEVELEDSELEKVPNKSKKLTIEKQFNY